jgi:hypothetical protein
LNLRDFVDNLDNPFSESDPLTPLQDERPPSVEITVDSKTGQPRQAGATQPEGAYITTFRKRAEANLYVFTKGVLMRNYLSPVLHTQVSAWAAQRNLYRKLLLLPRNHAKTSMIAHGLPIHLIIQPKDNNIYIPGRAGVDTRILLAGETEKRATNNLSVIQSAFEGNRLLRALWPMCCWDNPRKQADRWNKNEMVAPRNTDYPDATIQAMGVGGAITGARHDVHIKDDLVSFEAANSQVVMETAISWHLASRALLDNDYSLEFIIGTRWAVADLYEFIIHGGIVNDEKFDKDYTVDVQVRAIVEDGKTIYPEKFSLQRESGKQAVVDLMKEHGTMFPLLYMNSAADPSLVDFDMDDVRAFHYVNGDITFVETEADAALNEKFSMPVTDASQPDNSYRGVPLNKDTHDLVFSRQAMYTQPLRNVKSA